MKKYRITCQTDPYHASRNPRWNGQEILKWKGATPVKWVHDDDYGYGLSLEKARKKLMAYAHEDCDPCGEPIRHKFFENSYESDVYTYKIEEF